MPAFHSIEELLKTLSREQRLLKELFAKRKILSFRYEDALALVDYKEERIRKLVMHTLGREIWRGKLKKVQNLEMSTVGRGIWQEN